MHDFIHVGVVGACLFLYLENMVTQKNPRGKDTVTVKKIDKTIWKRCEFVPVFDDTGTYWTYLGPLSVKMIKIKGLKDL